jgi:hypothetical protein
LFFFGGVQLFFLGLIGEYVLAIYAQVREKPVVFERERINFNRQDASSAPESTPIPARVIEPSPRLPQT